MSNCSLTLISIINALKLKLPNKTFLLFADIQVAFDMAKPDVIHALLHLLYSDSLFPLLVARLNKSRLGEVSINGQFSTCFRLTRGTGQGDPAFTVKFSLLHALWASLTQHAIESLRNKLNQLMISYKEVMDSSISRHMDNQIPQAFPP